MDHRAPDEFRCNRWREKNTAFNL